MPQSLRSGERAAPLHSVHGSIPGRVRPRTPQANLFANTARHSASRERTRNDGLDDGGPSIVAQSSLFFSDDRAHVAAYALNAPSVAATPKPGTDVSVAVSPSFGSALDPSAVDVGGVSSVPLS